MDRCALFVDAGYALTDGAMAVHGTRRQESVSWDHAGLLKLLAGLARERTGLPVLRCYWYEIAEGSRTAEHDALAEMPGLKLRLVTSRPGRREGIEGQLRRDLLTLAKSGAISDAFVASADEDLAELVAEVQDLGLRVVVLHIASDDGWTIPQSLRQECDDIVEISGVHLRPFVDLIRGAEPSLREEPSYRSASAVADPDQSLAGTPAGAARSRTGLPARALPAAAAGADRSQETGSGSREAYEPTGREAASAYQADHLEPAAGAHSASGGPQQVARDVNVRRDNPYGYGADERRPAGEERANGNGSYAPPAQSGNGSYAPPAQAGNGNGSYAPPAQAGNGSGNGSYAPPPQAGNGSYALPAQGGNGNGSYAPPAQGGSAHGTARDREDAPGSGTRYGDSTYGRSQNGAAGHGGSRWEERSSQSPYATGPQHVAAPPGGAAPSGSVPHGYQIPAVPPHEGSAPPAGDGFANGGFANSGYVNGGLAPGGGSNGAGGSRHGAHGGGANGHGWTGIFDGGPANGTRGRDGQANDSAGDRGSTPPGGFQPAPVNGQASGHGPAPSPFPGQPAAGLAGSGLPAPGPTTPRQGVPTPPPAARPPVHDLGEFPAPQPSNSTRSGAPQRPQPNYPPDPAYRGGQPAPDWESADRGFQGRGTAPGYPPQPPQPQHSPSQLQHTPPQPQHSPQLQPQQRYQDEPRQPSPPSALPAVRQPQRIAVSLPDAVEAAHEEGFSFGESVSRDAPGLWLEAVLARKPRMPSDLEARLLQTSILPIDSLLHDEVRHSLRRGFWDALESARR